MVVVVVMMNAIREKKMKQKGIKIRLKEINSGIKEKFTLLLLIYLTFKNIPSIPLFVH